MELSLATRPLAPLFTALGVALSALALCAAGARGADAQTAPLSAHGQLLALAPRLQANTNTSSNWFGYVQGALADGGKLFNAISARWTVPRARQHTKGQAEASSDWIGIGGGCIDASCDLSDSTLIQVGTEQDVAADRVASYSAWWEAIPSPSLTITGLTVRPGNRIYASIAELLPDTELWSITLKDLTTHRSYTTTAAYPSTHDTAEWIQETPLEIGANAGFAALPRLTSPDFDLAGINGGPADLRPTQELRLTASNGRTIGTPSAPNRAADAFNACAWTSRCAPPRGG